MNLYEIVKPPEVLEKTSFTCMKNEFLNLQIVGFFFFFLVGNVLLGGC